MGNATAKIYLRDDFQRKDNSYPINLRVTIHRQTNKYSLATSALKTHWDNEKLRVKGGDLSTREKTL